MTMLNVSFFSPKRVLDYEPDLFNEVDKPAYHTPYFVASGGILEDHHTLFIQEDDCGRGRLYQVTGNIEAGMSFGSKPTAKPEESGEFQSKTRISTVTAGDK